MFGLAFLVGGNMAIVPSGEDGILVRVDPQPSGLSGVGALPAAIAARPPSTRNVPLAP